jgi:hypothetical protein
MNYVLSPFYPVADKIDTSHRAGWARYWAKELGAELLTTKTMDQVGLRGRGDTLYLYHGMEWSGAMNLQSGLTDEIVLRANRLIAAQKHGAKIISLDQPMPTYAKLLADRGYKNEYDLNKALSKSSFLTAPKLKPRRIIMGDSHALSQYVPDSVIFRADGQTLHGALLVGLNKRLDGFLFETGVEGATILTSYFGNIDIRHHIMRQPAPPQAIKEMVAEYGKQLLVLSRTFPVIEVVQPLPIENESRILPKTGWYKGTPFFGSWAERMAAMSIMNLALANMCRKHGFTYIRHPKHFINKQGELSFDVMECPRSVHIRPSEYRLVQEKLGW